MALTAELVELEEFFRTASKMAESYGEAALQFRMQTTRELAIPSHADVFVKW